MPDDPMTATPLVVLEYAGGAAAAYAARLLADLGATVTKLTDATAPEDDAAVALDLGKHVRRLDAGPAIADFDALLSGADVLLYEGHAAQLPEALQQAIAGRRYPRLVTAAVTPYGEHGPHAGYAGTDLTAIHAGGLGYGTPPRVTDPEREHPLGIPGDPASLLCGLILAGGVLHALIERDRDGNGRHVELSAQDAIASCMFNNVASAVGGGEPPSRFASARADARRPMYTCADGHLVVMANRPAHLRALLDAIGEPAAPLRQRLDGGTAPAAIRAGADELADAWCTTQPKQAVAELLQARQVPAAPVLDIVELLASPQLVARGFWRRDPALPDLRLPEHPFGPVADGDPPRAQPSVGTSLDGGAAAPLAGVRVVDFGWIFAAPIATRMLAALGATVLRVEDAARPDQMRERPFTFQVVYGDKQSVAIDAKSPEGKATLLALLRDADIVASNFAPGVMERLGLGWTALHALNPRLIMLNVSGMGQTGPYRHWRMFGQLAQGYAGLTALVGYEGGPPRGIEDGGFWSDPVAGYAAAAAALAALRERTATGRGRWIDVSLVESTAALFVRPLLAAQRDRVAGRAGNRHAAMAPHDTYRCAGDDRWLALAVRNDAEWQTLCRVIGRPDLADDPAFATLAGRQARRHDLRPVIEAWTGTRPAEAAAAELQAAGIPAAPSNTARDLLGDPHLRARRFFEEDPDAPGGVVMRAFPSWRLHPEPVVRYGPAPEYDQHTVDLPAPI